MSLAIVTDSSADIPPNLAQEYKIEVIPCLLMVGNQTYTDGESISREDFYTRLAGYQPPPSTAAPSIGVFQKVYERVIQNGATQILSIHPPASLSALFNIASKAAETMRIPVHVFDSSSVTLGTGYQVLAAGQAVAQGCTLEDVIACLDNLKRRVRVYALLDTLENVRRSGRVSWVSAALGNLLGVKALIEVRNGIVYRVGMSRSRRQAVDRLIQYLSKLGRLEELAVLHTSLASQTEIQNILAQAPRTPTPPLLLPVTPVIGTHVGPNGLGFAAVVA